MYMEDATERKTSGYSDHQASFHFRRDYRDISGGAEGGL